MFASFTANGITNMVVLKTTKKPIAQLLTNLNEIFIPIRFNLIITKVITISEAAVIKKAIKTIKFSL